MTLSLLAFIFVYMAGIVLAFVKHPKFGLYVYLLAFFIHPPSKWWGQALPDMRWSFYASILTMLAMMANKKFLREKSVLTHLPAKVILVYIMWMAIQLLWAISFEYQMIGFILLIKYFILYLMIFKLVKTREDVLSFLLAIVIGCLYLGYAARNAGGGRLEGVGGPGINDGNTLGMVFSIGLLIAATFMLMKDKKIIATAVISVPFILNGIILSQSRGAILGLLVGGFTFLRLKPPSLKKRFYLFGLLAVVAFLFLSNDQFWERIDSLAKSSEGREYAELSADEKSANSRIHIALAQLEIFKDYPLGVGHKGTALLSTIYIPKEFMDRSSGTRASHNTFLALLVDQGIVGAIAYLLVAWWIFISIGKLRGKALFDNDVISMLIISAIGGSLASIFVSGQFSNFSKAEVMIWLLALISVLLSIDDESTRTNEVRIDKSKRKIEKSYV